MEKHVVTPLSHLFENDSIISRRELKALMKRSNTPGLLHLALWLVLVGCTSTLVLSAQSYGLWLVPAMFLHGIVVVHHFALQHECSHYTAFRSRWICNGLATVCGFLLVIPPKFFRYEHCDHHTYTNQKGSDPELIELPDSRWQYLWYLSAIPYWKSQISGLLRRSLGKLTTEEKQFIPKSEMAAVIMESRLMLFGYVLVSCLCVVYSWDAIIYLWILPMVMAEPVMRFIRMTEHVGRPMVNDRTVNTRTNLVSSIWQFLAWNMNYHAEHHFAASVPFHALEKLHTKLKGHIHVQPHGYISAHQNITRQIMLRENSIGKP